MRFNLRIKGFPLFAGGGGEAAGTRCASPPPIGLPPSAGIAAPGELVLSPFPGDIEGLYVDVGQRVEAGQVMARLRTDIGVREVAAAGGGVVKQVLVHRDETVSAGDVLAVLLLEEAV